MAQHLADRAARARRRPCARRAARLRREPAEVGAVVRDDELDRAPRRHRRRSPGVARRSRQPRGRASWLRRTRCAPWARCRRGAGRASGCAGSRRCGRRSAARSRRTACARRPCRGCATTTWRCLCTPPCLALVTSFSTYGRSALALASVVVIAPASETMRCDGEVREHQLLVRGAPAEALALLRSGHASLLLDPQRQAALVELLDDLFERLRAEVGDGEQVVFGLLHELADRVDPRPLEAVARPLRQVELLDRRGRGRATSRSATRPRRARGRAARRRARRRGRRACAACRPPRRARRAA